MARTSGASFLYALRASASRCPASCRSRNIQLYSHAHSAGSRLDIGTIRPFTHPSYEVFMSLYSPDQLGVCFFAGLFIPDPLVLSASPQRTGSCETFAHGEYGMSSVVSRCGMIRAKTRNLVWNVHARQMFFSPVTFFAWPAIFSTTSSVMACTERARSISRWVSSLSGLRGGPPNSLAKRALVMVSPSR